MCKAIHVSVLELAKLVETCYHQQHKKLSQPYSKLVICSKGKYKRCFVGFKTELSNRMCLIQSSAQVIIQADDSMIGLMVVSQWKATGRAWSVKEENWNINILEF